MFFFSVLRETFRNSLQHLICIKSHIWLKRTIRFHLHDIPCYCCYVTYLFLNRIFIFSLTKQSVFQIWKTFDVFDFMHIDKRKKRTADFITFSHVRHATITKTYNNERIPTYPASMCANSRICVHAHQRWILM